MLPENRKGKMLISRIAIQPDKEKIISLYKEVSKNIGGIARTKSEITSRYIQDFMTKSAENGIQLIIEDPHNKNQLIAEIHCYKLTPKVFHHILSELTLVVHPSFQRMGIGEQLFTKLLDVVRMEMPHILRVELITRESNTRAIKLYEKIGFKIEGRFEKRIQSNNGDLEADIPMAWFNENYNKQKIRK